MSSSLFRFDMAQQNRSTLVTQLQHFPSGTSARTIVHTGQNIKQVSLSLVKPDHVIWILTCDWSNP